MHRLKEKLKIELVRDWNGYHRGSILPSVPRGQARMLISRGVAKEVKPPRRKRAKKKVSNGNH